MADTPSELPQADWRNAFDCGKIFGTFRMARQPDKIAIAVLALVFTLLWGTALDRIWLAADHGVKPEAEVLFLPGGVLAPVERDGEPIGIYAFYSAHCRAEIWRMARAIIPTQGIEGSIGQITNSALGIGRVTAWMFREHCWYSLLFWPVLLLFWSFAGGMICRIAAVQFARGEIVNWKEAYRFVRKRWLSGFFFAPLAPLLWLVVVTLLLMLGGLIFSIPLLGNTLGALFFFLALIGGVIGAVLLIGLIAGGGLMWPTIAVEGTSSFDAFSTSFHYVYTRPWRTLWYALVTFVYIGLCWLIVNLFAHLGLAIAHWGVNAGTVATRTVGQTELTKLEAVWSYEPFVGKPFSFEPVAVSGLDNVSVILIGLWVFLIMAVVWGFLASHVFSALTVIYFLLRRAVDLTDYDRVEEVEEYQCDDFAIPETPPPPSGEAPPESKPLPASATSESESETAASEPTGSGVDESITPPKPGDAEDDEKSRGQGAPADRRGNADE